MLPLALSLRQNAVKKAGVRSVRSACGTTWSEVAKFADQDGWREQRHAQTDMERHQLLVGERFGDRGRAKWIQMVGIVK